jgi:DNA-binding response OmpR family regulator
MDQILKLQHEDLEMDLVTHKVSRGAQSLDLTTKEFDLLEYLLRHNGRVVSREMLAHDVWHAMARATPLDNVIDVTIARLRRKIDGGVVIVRGLKLNWYGLLHRTAPDPLRRLHE